VCRPLQSILLSALAAHRPSMECGYVAGHLSFSLLSYLHFVNIVCMYGIVFTKQADRALRKMPRNTANRIRKKLDRIAGAPYGKHNNVTRLQNRPGYRLQVGDRRVIYEIQGNELVILVLKIGPRGGVY